MINSAPFRLIAIVLVVVLLVMVATPDKADAMEPLTIIAIIGAAAIVVVLIAYLVIANKEGRRAEDGPVYIACNGPDCLALALQTAASYGTVSSITVLPAVENQGP